MYEELVAYLLGKKNDFTDDDLDEFIELLNTALETTDEYELHKKQSIIESMVNHTEVTDRKERVAISNAIDSILHFDGEEEIDLFDDRSDRDTPLRSVKFSRGKKSTPEPATKKNRSKKRGDTGANGGHTKRVKGADQTKERGAREFELPTFVEQEDLLGSAGTETLSPDLPMTANAAFVQTPVAKPGQKMKFSELFALPANAEIAPGKYRMADKSSEMFEEFKFDIGDLESNDAEGPSVVFNTEDEE